MKRKRKLICMILAVAVLAAVAAVIVAVTLPRSEEGGARPGGGTVSGNGGGGENVDPGDIPGDENPGGDIPAVAGPGSVEVDAPTFSGRHGDPPSKGVSVVPANDPVKMDGVLDEDIYGSVIWKEWELTEDAVSGKKEETVSMRGVRVRATVVYGSAGFYTVFEVKNCDVFVDLEHNRYRFYDTGITPYIGFLGTSHNYEIYLTADGGVGVSSYVGGSVGYGEFELPGVESSAKVYDENGNPCEINTGEARGFCIEAYFPWQAFGFTGEQAAVMMDVAAVMNADAESDARSGWASMGEVFGNGWTWADPSTYFFWGSGGFENSPLELEIKNYDKSGGSVSFGSGKYNALDDVVINIEPRGGHIVRSARVNGTERLAEIENGVLLLKRYSGNRRLTVEVTFTGLPDNVLNISGGAKAVAGRSEPWALPEGTTLVFIGDGRYETKVGASGAYSLKLPRGTYDVSANGYGTETVEIEAAGEQNISLRWNLIPDTDNYLVAEDDGSASVNNLWQRAGINLTGGDFIMFYTIRANDGFLYENSGNMGLYFYYGPGEKDYYSLQYVGYNGGFIAKLCDAARGDAVVGSQLNAGAQGVTDAAYFAENGQKIMAVADGNILKYYLRDMSGCYRKVAEVAAPGGFTKGELMNWTTEAYYDGITYYPGLNLQNGHVEIGGDAFAVAGASRPWSIPDGTVLTFRAADGSETAAAVTGGKYSANLTTGIYTVSANGFTSADIVAEASETFDLTLRWNLVSSSDKYDVGANDDHVSAKDANSSVDINLTGGDFVFFATIKTKTGVLETGINTWRSVRFITGSDDAGNNITVSFFRFSGNYSYAKMTRNGFDTLAESNYTQKLLSKLLPDDEFAANGMRIMIVLKDEVLGFYIADKDGNWVMISETADGTDFTKAQFVGKNCTNRQYTDISYYAGTGVFDELELSARSSRISAAPTEHKVFPRLQKFPFQPFRLYADVRQKPGGIQSRPVFRNRRRFTVPLG